MIFKMPNCGGCRTCEIACSYHHKRNFNPAISSLIVHEREMGEGYDIELIEKKEGLRMACDGCLDLDVPLCVQHCEAEKELVKILNDFLRKKSR